MIPKNNKVRCETIPKINVASGKELIIEFGETTPPIKYPSPATKAKIPRHHAVAVQTQHQNDTAFLMAVTDDAYYRFYRNCRHYRIRIPPYPDQPVDARRLRFLYRSPADALYPHQESWKQFHFCPGLVHGD